MTSAGGAELVKSLADPEQLKRVRAGGLEVVDTKRHGEQVSSYTTDRACGFWTLTVSPEGHEIRVDDSLPMA